MLKVRSQKLEARSKKLKFRSHILGLTGKSWKTDDNRQVNYDLESFWDQKKIRMSAFRTRNLIPDR